jgi:hypothetical protein
MGTLLALLGIFGAGFALGWAQGSKDGFNKAVEQLERIVKQVERRR